MSNNRRIDLLEAKVRDFAELLLIIVTGTAWPHVREVLPKKPKGKR